VAPENVAHGVKGGVCPVSGVLGVKGAWEIGCCGGAQIDACAAARSGNATKSPLGQQATGESHKKGRGRGQGRPGGGKGVLFEKAASICYLHVSKSRGFSGGFWGATQANPVATFCHAKTFSGKFMHE